MRPAENEIGTVASSFQGGDEDGQQEPDNSHRHEQFDESEGGRATERSGPRGSGVRPIFVATMAVWKRNGLPRFPHLERREGSGHRMGNPVRYAADVSFYGQMLHFVQHDKHRHPCKM